jgi:predicted permease
MVSVNFLDVLGTRAVLGRTFLPADDADGASPVVLLSESFWERRFNRDVRMLGQHLKLDSVDVTIVGITPRDFTGTSPTVPDVWLPLVVSSRLARNVDLPKDWSDCCTIYGRLKDDVSPRQAQAEMDTRAARLQAPGSSDRRSNQADRFVVTRASLLGESVSTSKQLVTLGTIQGAMSLILLIACANVGGLLLARAAARQKEIATRLAIGASRSRVIRQLLTESFVMSIIAGILSVVISWWLLRLLALSFASSIVGTLALQFEPDYRVLLYTLILSAITTVAFGLAPAVRASKSDLTSALKDEGGRFGGHLGRSRLSSVFITVQVSVCLLLLMLAGFFLRSSRHALDTDLGFDSRRVVSLDITFPPGTIRERIAILREQLSERLRSLPGVESVSTTSLRPLGGSQRVLGIGLAGQTPNNVSSPTTLVNMVSPGYFQTLNIPIVRGRDFTLQEMGADSDFDGSPIILSEGAARLFFPRQDAIGQRMSFDACLGCRILPRGEKYPHSTSSVVVGIVKDVRSTSLLRRDDSLVYLPSVGDFGDSFVMRTRGDTNGVMIAVRHELKLTGMYYEAKVSDYGTSIASQSAFVVSRIGGILLAAIGLAGLLMACIGIYGTVGYAVTQRAREIGIRMALGAQRRDVIRHVLIETMSPVVYGLIAGFTLEIPTSVLLSSRLSGSSAFETTTFLIPALFALVALLAGYFPALRATRIDALSALRQS